MKPPRFTADSLLKLQTSRNLSGKDILAIAAANRVVYGRNTVEPNLKNALYDRNHCLDDIFETRKLKMKTKADKKTG